jgi:cyclophilin family peptidyl-prolyl cis-trans isomerase
MPRSRRFRKNRDKPEWGKNNPRTKAKNRKMMITVGILAVVVVVVSALLLVGGVFNKPSTNPSSSPSPTATPQMTAQPSASPATSPAGEYSANGIRILLQTSMGNITVQMRDDKPITTANFINLTQLGLYDSTIFHRVLAGFMIQGGVVETNLQSIVDEIGNDNQNVIGTLAMAKRSDPNSATSSFFINVANNNKADFDSTYTVFGKVIGGMEVVNAIANVAVGPNELMGGEKSAPLQTITLIRAIVLP